MGQPGAASSGAGDACSAPFWPNATSVGALFSTKVETVLALQELDSEILAEELAYLDLAHVERWAQPPIGEGVMLDGHLVRVGVRFRVRVRVRVRIRVRFRFRPRLRLRVRVRVRHARRPPAARARLAP